MGKPWSSSFDISFLICLNGMRKFMIIRDFSRLTPKKSFVPQRFTGSAGDVFHPRKPYLCKKFKMRQLHIFFIGAFMACTFLASCQVKQPRYMALGDSYTIGEGLPEAGRFPDQLSNMLKERGAPVELCPNPARTGWTTRDLIENELPLFKKAKPELATLLIGVNDWVQGVDETTFRKNLAFILDEMIRVLPSSDRLLVLTIPDFSATPEGAKYGRGRDITAGIARFNAIIAEECIQRNLNLTDIFPATREMKGNPVLTAADGLHPSADEYRLWASMLLPRALEVLKNHSE
jgi:lysophospholipase L1-like esterase